MTLGTEGNTAQNLDETDVMYSAKPFEQAPEIEVTSENIHELLTSKSFKHRTLAYQKINEHPQFVGLLQNETLAVALEGALDALIGYDGTLRNAEIANLYLQLSQGKPAIKAKLNTVIEKAFENDKLGVVAGLGAHFGHKNAKVVGGCVSKTNTLIGDNIEAFRDNEAMKQLSENICPKLEMLFSSADKDVRTESGNLALTLYRLFHDGLLKYLENVKPIILNGLKESFQQVEMPKRDVKISDMDFENADWKIRLSSVTHLRDNIPRMSNMAEAMPIVSRRIRDLNLAVATAAVECVAAGLIVHPDCVRGMIERFKDKKLALTQMITRAIQTTKPDVNILIDGLANKNPDVRTKILECLKFYTITRRIGEIGKMLEDGSPSVRKAAVDVLRDVDDLSELNETQRSKLGKQVPKETKSAEPKPPAHVEPKPDVTRSPSAAQERVQDLKSRVCDVFAEKYPALFDKDWNKKLEFIVENRELIKSEGCRNIVQFLVASKETNLAILKEFMSILSSFDDLSTVEADLCGFLCTKVTETKLRDSVIDLFRRVGRATAVQCILQAIEHNKVGKKFLSLLDVLTNIVSEQDDTIDTFLDKVKVFGMQEKRALIEFTTQYRNRQETPQQVKEPPKKTNARIERASDSFVGPPDNAGVFKMNADPNGSLNEVFTDEFLELFRENTFIAVGVLEKADICKYASAVLLLYRQHSLPSPYFNSLILRLIGRKFIISDQDAHELINHLLENPADAEIELLDRIYPATKLYKLLRGIPKNAGLSAIFTLARKYKDLNSLKVQDIESAVRSSEDFITFSVKIDQIIDMKVKLMSRLDQAMAEQADRAVADRPGHHFRDHNSIVISEPNAEDGIMSDEDDLGDLEDSIIIERSLVPEDVPLPQIDTAASVVRAPSIFDIDLPASGPHGLSFTNDFNVPSVKIEDEGISFEIERSLENISISTTPLRKKRNLSEIESVLAGISSDCLSISVASLEKLAKIILENPNSISFSSNTIISTVLIHLMARYSDMDYRNLALGVLLKFTQNAAFCSCLRYETLKSVHADLVPLVKNQTTVADILINLCLNCELQILKVYFDLLESTDEVLMKLIWRHSKRIKYTSVETTAAVVNVIDCLYEEKKAILARSDNIVLKVCLLHLKECIAAFSDNLKQFGVGKITEEVINVLLSPGSFNMDEIRAVFRGNR